MAVIDIKHKLPAPPTTVDAALSGYLASLHRVVSGLQAQATQVPQLPTALSCTPVAGGTVIAFTRSASTRYRLYISPTPDRTGAQEIDLGNSNTYHHFAGSGALTFHYWVEGLNQAGASSGLTPPVSGTTLALATPTTIPTPASISYGKVHDTLSNTIRPIDYTTDQIPEGKRPTP